MLIHDNLPVYRKMYAFALAFHRALRNLPREHRYSLGAETAEIARRCLDLIAAAAGSKRPDKEVLIAGLSGEFDRLNLRLRLLQEIGAISAGQYAHWQEQYLSGAGTQIGGWQKWAEAPAENKPAVSPAPDIFYNQPEKLEYVTD